MGEIHQHLTEKSDFSVKPHSASNSRFSISVMYFPSEISLLLLKRFGQEE